MELIKDLVNNPPDISNIHISKKARLNRETDPATRYYIDYIDIAIAFDCEVYSFKGPEDDKRAIMWAWGLAIADKCYLGRTWPEFIQVLDVLKDAWDLNYNRRVIIWVHNLSYDFSFFRKWFKFDNVFALDSRQVCYCDTEDGIEFRCSYILTGYSLEKVGEHLLKHNIKKLTGSIDYKLPRTPITPLTEEEIDYLEHDCLIVTAHIEEQIDIEGGLSTIPLTATGYVRRYCRNACFRDVTKKASDDFSRVRYMQFMHSLPMSPFVYKSLKRAFQGGYTHSNPFYTGDVIEGVTSLDIRSDYPSVICSELFPMTPPEIITINDYEQFKHNLKHYCCVFTVEIVGLKAVINYDHYISFSHCYIEKGTKVQVSNGRIVQCDKLVTTITNVDWEIITRNYKMKGFKVMGFIRWGKGYLPKPIIESTIKFYKDKTELKGKEGKEQEYMMAKMLLNALYGMMVEDPLRDIIPYNLKTNDWGEYIDTDSIDDNGEKIKTLVIRKPLTPEEQEQALNAYNETSVSRFLYYAWGIFVTAYARKNLWRGILEFKDDYIYSDTDSLKVLNLEDHLDYIRRHDMMIQAKIKACLEYHKMDTSLSSAFAKIKDKDTKKERIVEQKLGTWDNEGTYLRFKTLGAKRYMVENAKEEEYSYKWEGEEKTVKTGISITVSGINKKSAIPYILEKADGKPFEFFSDQMEIPPGYCGKNAHYYGDCEINGTITDYLGNSFEYYEKSYVYMEEAGYCLKMSGDYVQYLDALLKGMLDG